MGSTIPVTNTPGERLRVDVRLVSLLQRAPLPHGCSASAEGVPLQQ